MGTEKYLNRFYQVDVFTDKAFSGNPTGVCILNKQEDGSFLSALSAEFGLNQIAFLVKQPDGFHTRFFTKFAEVPMCSHASIAAAHVLHMLGEVPAGEPVLLKSPRTELSVGVEGENYKIQLPEYQIKKVEITPQFIEVTGSTPTELYSCSHDWHLAYFKDHEDIRRVLPHFVKMKHSDFGSLIVTSHGHGLDVDYIQRSFAPNHGVNEEDVTGPAQCALVPFWREKLHKKQFVSHQATTRGGVVVTRSLDDKKVEILGRAIIIMEGRF